MKMMKKLIALALALLLCAACAMAETAAAPEDVMVTVNGEAITRAEYDEYLDTLVNYYASLGYDLTVPENDAAIKELAAMTLIQFKVMDQKIVELDVQLTDEEKADAAQIAREEWADVVDSGLSYYGVTEESTEDERAAILVMVLAELEGMGYTEEAYIEESIQTAAYVKLEDHMAQSAEVTDDEVIAYYNELVEADRIAYENDAAAYEQMEQMNQMYLMYGYADYYVDLYYRPEGYRSVTHILLNADETALAAYNDLVALYEEQQSALEEGQELTGTPVTAEEVETARLAVIASVQPTIDEINQKMAEGATFAELIPVYTADPGMATPEAVAEGYAVHMDSITWVTEFRDAAFTVDNIGDVAEPVVTSYGVHLVCYAGDIPGGPVELTADTMELLRLSLLEAEKSSLVNTTLDQWVTEAEVIVVSAELADYVILPTAE